MFKQRTGLIIWISDLKAVRSLEKYGSIHFTSTKLKYVVLYVNEEKVEEIKKNIQRMQFVKKIESSYRKDIKTEYSSDMEDKTRSYSI